MSEIVMPGLCFWIPEHRALIAVSKRALTTAEECALDAMQNNLKPILSDIFKDLMKW